MKHQVTKWAVPFAMVTVMTTVAGCGAGANNGANTTTGAGNTTAPATQNAGTTLNETGSSLLYPLFNDQWISAYKSVAPNVKLTAASTGSGAGISQAIAGTVQIGASDAYMADAQVSQNPSMLNIPVAVSAQQVMYNLPGMSTNQHLKFNGNVLADIYMGKVTYWDDAAIKSLNPGVSLPHKQIIPIHRSDSSGDTFLFTQFLSKTNSTWNSQYQYSTSPSWPAVQTSIGAKGNSGMVTALAGNPYSIAYVGISWLDKATKQGIGYAALQNQAGSYVLPQTANIQAAANALVSKVPADERVSLIYAPGATSYPIVNFEYTIVNSKQASSNVASSLKSFLNWAIDPKGGNNSKYLTPVHFLPLPISIEPKSKAQIAKITS